MPENKLKLLILDANEEFGGNARRDDQPPMSVMASTASSYSVAPYAEFQKQLYDAIGLAFEPTPVRQARLAESITVLKGLFSGSSFSFADDSTARSPSSSRSA